MAMATDDTATAMAGITPYHTTRLLEALPIELLFRIARHLSTTEYCALRLSCRAVEKGLFHAFSHEFFTRKQFMMSEFSLQALVDIAQHPSLSKRLEHVSFGLEHLGHIMAQIHARPHESRFYAAAVSDQSTIFSSGRASEMLTEAFSRLRNLKTVSIRDWNSRTRFRDYNSGHKHWYGYGVPTLRRNTGDLRENNTTNERSVFLTNVFNAVTTALANSGARPKNIEVLLRDKQRGLQDSSFWISPRLHDQETNRRMLAGLCKLHLDIALSRYSDAAYQAVLSSPRLRANPPILDDDGLKFGINCNRYIALTAQSLEWLRININVHEHVDEGADAFMTYFTNPSNSKSIGDRIVYPRLKRLDIGYAHVALSSVCSMLEGLPSVEILSLFNITLVSRGARDPDEILWQTLLLKLPVILPKLQRVEIAGAHESVSGRSHDVVLERDNYKFIIQVRGGENAVDECTKAAAKLEYRYNTPEIDSNDDEDEEEVDDDGEGEEQEEEEQEAEEEEEEEEIDTPIT